MSVEYESEKYSWNYDNLYGVGNFTRKSDDAVTMLETGSDCQEMRRSFHRLLQKTSSKRYPKSAPSFNEIFDSIASEYNFD
jgi:hypothetical protein